MNKLEPVPWRGIRAPEKLIIIALPLIAAVVLILPFLDQVILRRLSRLPGARPLVVWLVSGYNAWIVGLGILLLAGLFMLWVRHRLVRNQRLWYGTGCPNCMERELVRVSRQKSDRLYALLAIPAYRYACRNCTWRGLRIARRVISPERELELEEALLRFQPDGLPAGVAAGHSSVRDLEESNAVVLADSPDLFDEQNDEGWAEDQEQMDEAITVTLTEPSDLFGQLDDEIWIEDQEQANDIGGEVEPSEEDNHLIESKQLEGMEWLWRRSSDT